MTTKPAVYIARMEVDPTYLREFMTWYDSKHAYDAIAVGHWTAQSYHSRIGKPLVCNVYEIAGSEDFYIPIYSEVRKHDPQRDEVLSKLENRSNTVYAQALTHGVNFGDVPWEEGGRAGAIDASCLTTLRFDVDDRAIDSLLSWYADSEFDRLAAAGASAVRVCHQDGPPHITNPSTEPHWTVVTEWADREGALAAGAPESIEERHRNVLGDTLHRFSSNLVVRVYSHDLHRGHPPAIS